MAEEEDDDAEANMQNNIMHESPEKMKWNFLKEKLKMIKERKASNRRQIQVKGK